MIKCKLLNDIKDYQFNLLFLRWKLPRQPLLLCNLPFCPEKGPLLLSNNFPNVSLSNSQKLGDNSDLCVGGKAIVDMASGVANACYRTASNSWSWLVSFFRPENRLKIKERQIFTQNAFQTTRFLCSWGFAPANNSQANIWACVNKYFGMGEQIFWHGWTNIFIVTFHMGSRGRPFYISRNLTNFATAVVEPCEREGSHYWAEKLTCQHFCLGEHFYREQQCVINVLADLPS